MTLSTSAPRRVLPPLRPSHDSRTKPPPEGFDEIEDILEEYERKMRDGASAPFEGSLSRQSGVPLPSR